MGDSPASSDLSDPPSGESDGEDQISNSGGRTSRRSLNHGHLDSDTLAPPSKRRKTARSTLVNFDRAPSSHVDEEDDNISVSSDGYSSVPGSPGDDEYALRDQAQTQCMWRDCDFGVAINNDELVKHVQTTHCATGGPKKTRYVCEWGECQRKTSNHPSGYALKAHMRSHTKEKPYYCALPECDKAFTRSDALAKHMRTVHEPEPLKGSGGAGAIEAPPWGKKGAKNRLTNGNSAASPKPPSPPQDMGPTHDEDGNEVAPSPANDNITYVPAHHPITGQPGFMIHYPSDINFTAWESSISADQLMRLLRRQIHWVEKDAERLKAQIKQLERQKREEWTTKEILLEGVLEGELAQAEHDDVLRKVDVRVREAMKRDVEPAKRYTWTGAQVPPFRQGDWSRPRAEPADAREEDDEDVSMRDVSATPRERRHSQSPPPTGMSGGFDGDDNPYDNYLQATMAKYEERERIRSTQNTPAKGELAPNPDQQAAEADAVGALLDMSGGKS